MIEMREVLTNRDIKKFINFQSDLYKGVEQFIPSLFSDEYANIRKDKNPAYDYCEARYWLAYREGNIVGRVSGIINHAANEKWKQKRIRVCRIDFIDDLEVSKTLVETVAAWGRERGLTEMVGPLGFCDVDKQGMLLDGYDKNGLFITIYNYPYYVEHFEKIGFEKDVDWVEHRVSVQLDPVREAKMDRICERVAKKAGVTVKFLTKKKDVAPYVEKVLGLLNVAFRDIYGTVPLPERQMKYLAKQYVPLINLDYLPLIEKDGKLVAFGLLAPSVSGSIKKCGGKLFPFGWINLLKTIKNPQELEMLSVGVLDEYKNTGLTAVLINEVLKNARKNGVVAAETGPELEMNYKVGGMWEGFVGEFNFKRRRCWKKSI